MTMLKSGTASARTPHFYELYDRLKQMEVEQPNALIVAYVPFLRAVDSDLRCYMGVRAVIQLREELTAHFVMRSEVESVRDGLLLGLYSRRTLMHLEEWSLEAIKAIEDICKIFDEKWAEYLHREHQLN